MMILQDGVSLAIGHRIRTELWFVSHVSLAGRLFWWHVQVIKAVALLFLDRGRWISRRSGRLVLNAVEVMRVRPTCQPKSGVMSLNLCLHAGMERELQRGHAPPDSVGGAKPREAHYALDSVCMLLSCVTCEWSFEYYLLTAARILISGSCRLRPWWLAHCHQFLAFWRTKSRLALNWLGPGLTLLFKKERGGGNVEFKFNLLFLNQIERVILVYSLVLIEALYFLLLVVIKWFVLAKTNLPSPRQLRVSHQGCSS